MSLRRLDVIMTSSKMPFLLYQRWKTLRVFRLINLTNLNICLKFLVGNIKKVTRNW